MINPRIKIHERGFRSNEGFGEDLCGRAGRPTFTAVKGINLNVEDGEFMVLVGPSGCGKSTTLRMIAGLERVTGGTISIGGQVVNNLEPKERGIADGVPELRTLPHMTIFKNMAFALGLAKKKKAFISEMVGRTARRSSSIT